MDKINRLCHAGRRFHCTLILTNLMQRKLPREGCAVNVGVIYNVLKALVIRDIDLLKNHPELTRAIIGAPTNPDHILENYSRLFAADEESRKVQRKKPEKRLKLAL